MLGLPAAPSFATFLTLTSGLGMDEFNQIWIVGVGLQSVQHAVLPERVQDCDTFSGIAGLWCSCVATYDFERERDQLEQRASCRSEYRHLIPFMFQLVGSRNQWSMLSFEHFSLGPQRGILLALVDCLSNGGSGYHCNQSFLHGGHEDRKSVV